MCAFGTRRIFYKKARTYKVGRWHRNKSYENNNRLGSQIAVGQSTGRYYESYFSALKLDWNWTCCQKDVDTRR